MYFSVFLCIIAYRNRRSGDAPREFSRYRAYPATMEVFEREARIRAPLDEVWAFHATVDGLRRVTPGWMNLRVERVEGPDGDAGQVELVPGSTVWLAMRPLGVGPRVEWTSQITAREERGDEAFFRDEMRQGPLRRWVHTHRFVADGDATLLRDRVEFETPLGGAADRVTRLVLGPVFRDRHRRTRRLLERGGRAADSRT
jgi:ligand-binding SRPBCC domain-containing protein